MPVSVMLAYEAYFDALKPLHTTSDAWKSILAGLVVLRLVDDWLNEGTSAITKNPASVQAAREAIARIPERDRVRPILCNLVDIVTQSEQIAVQTIADSVLDYGNMLEMAGRWPLSRDVFASLLNRAQNAQDHLTTARTARRLGLILRMLGQLDASDRVYTLVHQMATRINIPKMDLGAHIGSANNLVMRGRLAEAGKILDTVATEAKSLGMTDIWGDALHEQSAIALERKDYLTGIRISQTVLMHVSNPVERDRVLINIGAAFVGHGDHSAAKDFLIPLLQRTQEEGLRQMSLINLLEIAAKDGDKTAFERYHHELDGILTLPALQAHYHLYLGKGYYTFGSPAAAVEEWQYALAIAEEHGLNQVRSFIIDDFSAVCLQ
jgi:tetratricopeptide (TPR) repeat protein